MSDFIKLSKREKTVLLAIQKGNPDEDSPIPYSEDIMRAVVSSLTQKGLIKGILTKCTTWGRLTDSGILYLEDNPKLRDPINWDSVRSWIAIIIAAIALVSQIIEQILERVL